MYFDDILKESSEENDVDALLPQDPDTEEGIERIADQVEDAMQAQALESASYFDGGEEAVKSYIESAEMQAIQEAFPLGAGAKRRTIVSLNKNDDITRRARLAALVIAREKKDPLFNKLAANRIKEKALRRQIFQKYGKQALKVARISKKKHDVEKKKMHGMPIMAAPKPSTKEPSYNDVFTNIKR